MAEPDDGVLTGLLLAFRDFAQPVIDACASPEAMEFFWYQHGWRISLDGGGLAQLDQVLPIGTIGRELEQVADAVTAQRASGGTPSLDDVARLADVVARLAETLTTLAPASLTNLAGPLGEAATWEDLGEQLFDTLLEQYLREYHSVIYLILLVSGCLRYEARPAVEPTRVDFVRAVFDWEQPEALLRDPIAALAKTYHWGDPAAQFDHGRVLDVLGRVLRPLGVEADLMTPTLQLEPGLPAGTVATIRTDVDALRATILHGVALDRHVTYEVGFDVLPAGPAADGPPSGLILRPRLKGGVTEAIPVGASFTLAMAVDASVGDVLGVSLFPGQASLTGGDVVVGTSIELMTSLDGPFYLVGTAGSARIELRNPSIRVSLEGTADDAELRLRLGTAGGPSGGQPGARVVIPMGQSDSFVQDSVGSGDIQFSFSPEVIWSSATGFAVNGSSTPKIDLPLSIKIGSFTLKNATIALADATSSDGKPAYQILVRTDVAGSIGPVTAVVQGLGFAVQLVPYSRADLLALPPGASRPALGNFDVSLGFAPPTGVGLSIDAGAVTGGGFLAHAEDEYGGALDLAIGDVAVKAYGLVQTRLPGGQPGYSLIAVISTEFSPPIELPFGFTLEGVGGLIGVNRTIDENAVQSALWAHHLDGLLFPADPVAAAPQLLTALDSYFPGAHGRYVFGPLAKLGWGGVVDGELALLLELPEPVKLLLIGEIQALVPSDAPQLRLHVSFDGGIDFGKKLAFFDASLHDSYITTYPISGDLAFRYGWGGDAALALALGGFNPHFQPPPGFPALKRLAITIDSSVAQIEAQAYLALTSNTLQFGARVELTAGTGGFNVHGWLGFDALCERDPLSFEFDLSAGVDLRHGTDVLASVHLDGKLSGPSPWHISGEASISLLFFDISVHFDNTWGDEALQVAAPDPLAVVLAALGDRSGWSGALGVNARMVVTVLGDPADADDVVLLDPGGSLRIAQRAIPLGRPVTRFAGAPLGRTVQLTIDDLTVLGTAAADPGPVTEEFAPGQFLDLSDAEQLSLPSFNPMDAGVEVGAAAVDLGSGNRTRAVATPFEYDTTIVDTQVRLLGLGYVIAETALLTFNVGVQGAAPGLARYAPPAAAPPLVALAPERWVVAGTADLVLHADVAADGSKVGAKLALDAYLAANPSAAGQLQVVLAEEAP